MKRFSYLVCLFHLCCACSNGLLNSSSSSGGQPISVCAATSNFGTALSFNGSSQYVQVNMSTSVGLGTGNSVTIEGHFQPLSLSGTQTYFTDGINTLRVSNGSPTSYVLGAGCTSTLGTSSGPSFAVGSKNHIAMTFNGTTGVQTLYVNGASVMSVTGTVNSICGTSLLQLGFDTPGGYFNGVIDDVRISNILRYSTAFVAPSGPLSCDANTVFLYRFDSNFATYPVSAGTINLFGAPPFITSPFP